MVEGGTALSGRRGKARARWLVGVVALVGVGCPSGAEEPAGGPDPLEPVPGRRYRFALRSAAGLAQVYEVTEVSPLRVRYRVRTSQGGRAAGPALSLAWSRAPAPGWVAGSGEPATLALGDRTLDCRVAERADGFRVWTAVRDGRPAFPGIVRVADGEGAVVLELVAVE